MKLNKRKVRYILHQNRKQVSIKEIARDLRASPRRVVQITSNTRKQGKSRSWAKMLAVLQEHLMKMEPRQLVILTLAIVGRTDVEANYSLAIY